MYVSIDTETTGLDPVRHALISVAFVFKPDLRKDYIAAQMEFKMNPGTFEIDPKALAVNGYTEEEIRTWPDRKKTAETIDDMLLEWGKAYGKLKPVGQNYQFDRGFLLQIMPFYRYNSVFDYHYLDTMVVGDFLNLTGMITTAGTSLNSFRDFYGFPREGAHTALKDAFDTIEILGRMLDEI